MKSVRRDLLVACRHHAGHTGARRRLSAAAGERREHFHTVIGEPLSDGRAHHAGRDHGNDGSHGCSIVIPGRRESGKANPYPAQGVWIRAHRSARPRNDNYTVRGPSARGSRCSRRRNAGARPSAPS